MAADRAVDLPYLVRWFRSPISFFLVHATAHCVERRTEVKLILAERGIATPDLDGWPYAEAAGYGQLV